MERKFKKAISLETFIFLAVLFAFFYYLSSKMGAINLINTFMNTAYALLMEVCFYIMAIAVVAGGLSAILSEFGVISLINKLLSKLMKPIYDLPGAASVGVLTCYLSDNPSILALAKDKNFLRYFKKYQVPVLTNIGTAFGMGFITTTTMMGLKIDGSIKAALIGNLGAIIGSIVSVRIMMIFTKKKFGAEAMAVGDADASKATMDLRPVREGSTFNRFIDALLDGGKIGVDMGLSIVPGVILICTVVLILTNGPGPDGLYTGAAKEGVKLLPMIADKLSFIIKPLFGFTSGKCIAVPITALGSAGAAIGLVPELINTGAANASDVAVFTAICMCWSGYLSTHIAMMDALGYNDLAGKSIFAHTIGGLAAGFSAHILFTLLA